MVRKLLEEMTGIHTGSDTRPKRAMAEMLRGYGLQGESDVTRKSWVIKSHFPERHGWMKFPVTRGILLVRHPVNAIDSYFNMQLSANHEMSLDESQYDRFADIWNEHVETEARVWTEFHEYWMKQAIPLLVVRYEDLLVHRERELGRIFRFLYRPMEASGVGGGSSSSSSSGGGGGGGSSSGSGSGSNASSSGGSSSGSNASAPEMVAGTPWVSPSELHRATERYQNMLQSTSKNSGVVYKPRKASINPDCTHYSSAQQTTVLQTGAKYLRAFGYVATDNNNNNNNNNADTTIALPQPIIRCLNKGCIATLKVNDGAVCREITEEDPYGRGFPWKMKIRRIVMLEGKTEPGAVDQNLWLQEQNARNQFLQDSPFAAANMHGEQLPQELVEPSLVENGGGAGSMEEEEEKE